MSGRQSRRPEPVRGLAGPKAEKTISLALQGGGAHGAFTWGVLDVILEDGRLGIEALTGTSAGAMNAVVVAEGWIDGGADGARAKLEAFWRAISVDGKYGGSERSLIDTMLGAWGNTNGTPPGMLFFEMFSKVASPYDVNPLNINPLRGVVADLIDFAKVRAHDAVKLFIAATNVRTGKIAVFERKDLTADHVMASACLPMVFQAVEIDGEAYWDGGYMGNPALFPLFYEAHCDDILLVQINPIQRRELPTKAREIQDRLNEITFNASLLRELRAIDFVNRLVDDGKLKREDYKRVLMHRIDGGPPLAELTSSSRMNAEWDFLLRLRDMGRTAAKRWLKRNYDAIGKTATLDLKDAIT
ncbi:MAG: patatin-like phospholipase family protein [Bosea sp. (in: a-proteobacteria)]|uniref:patatin-like phospholipase family protein n=1 Tax=unclassified Bosea (in: a-proteobacteria) TaxID=2653178 RepID=UPI000ABF49F8|nr:MULTISPECIES: patatin-like phospholipase family protein [unclassified Bosea (in: a-proteobacteria)]MBN9441236.1 patatin-like phospholipase family protein [Bosea sp. (in: a-proteobacteria)]MBN9458793.1 patatin-like phospholipase family protein [Bosea sp. (in: a-proteobacteria)]